MLKHLAAGVDSYKVIHGSTGPSTTLRTCLRTAGMTIGVSPNGGKSTIRK